MQELIYRLNTVIVDVDEYVFLPGEHTDHIYVIVDG